jgi:phage protein D
MMMTEALKTRLDLSYKGTSLDAKVEGWSYTDNLSGEADDFELTVEDTKHLWMGKWMPKKGSTVKASIIQTTTKKKTFVKGLFEIDQIEISGPPSVAAIKGISVPNTSSIRAEGHHQAWEKTTLRKIASDIASRNRMKLVYDVQDTIKYDRTEQSGESDLAVLMTLCDNEGLALKVSSKQLVIFSERSYEERASKATIKRSNPIVLTYKGTSSFTGLYRSCKVSFQKKDMKKTYHVTFTDPHAPSGVKRVLTVQEDVKDETSALRRAKARLRDANKDGQTMELTLYGYQNYYAGMTVTLSEFGHFNGKYIVTTQSASSGEETTTTLSLRKCLRGY